MPSATAILARFLGTVILTSSEIDKFAEVDKLLTLVKKYPIICPFKHLDRWRRGVTQINMRRSSLPRFNDLAHMLVNYYLAFGKIDRSERIALMRCNRLCVNCLGKRHVQYYGFQVTEDVRRPYVEQVKNYIENGYAREIPVDSIRVDTVWSLPDHGFKHKPYSKI